MKSVTEAKEGIIVRSDTMVSSALPTNNNNRKVAADSGYEPTSLTVPLGRLTLEFGSPFLRIGG
jgi:hypothetical protein